MRRRDRGLARAGRDVEHGVAARDARGPDDDVRRLDDQRREVGVVARRPRGALAALVSSVVAMADDRIRTDRGVGQTRQAAQRPPTTTSTASGS
jgi:hypothetical protein